MRAFLTRIGVGFIAEREEERVPEHRLTSDSLTIDVNSFGAELSSIRHRDYGELLWQAEPIWPKHAPNLFPIVGQLPEDTLLHDGRPYTLKRHGFAREKEFAWQQRSDAACTLVLEDDAQTSEIYPFKFRFEIAYVVTEATLQVDFSITNTGSDVLPASVGAHPAFRWPLQTGIDKDAHTLVFSHAEPSPIRRLTDGLLQFRDYDTPVHGKTLHLHESLFAADAVIFDRLASESVRYCAPGAPTIEVSWSGFRELGVWSMEGAAFLCIEPWYGYSTPIGFNADFDEKPGLLHIAPGKTETFTMRIRVLEAVV